MEGPVLREGSYSGMVCVVTGGGTGIGLEMARQMHELGASVMLVGRREEALRSAAREMGERGAPSRIHWTSCDIRDERAVLLMVQRCVRLLGPSIHVLINNAGGQYRTSAEDCSPKGFNAVLRLNLSGTWNVIHHVVNCAMLQQREPASILNVVANVRQGFPGMVHTGAARAGVINLTKTCAQEWARHGIRVNAIAPGVIWSSGTQKHYPREILELATTTQPIQRLGTVHEVAWLALYLSHPKIAAFITGQCYYICGGQSIVAPGFMAKY